MNKSISCIFVLLVCFFSFSACNNDPSAENPVDENSLILESRLDDLDPSFYEVDLPTSALKESYNEKMKQLLPDEYYAKILNELIPHGEEIMSEVLKKEFPAGLDSSTAAANLFFEVLVDKGYENEVKQYYAEHPWNIDSELSQGKNVDEYKHMYGVLNSLPGMYRAYPDLTAEQYIKLSFVYMKTPKKSVWEYAPNSVKVYPHRYPFREACVLGFTDENSRKLTYQDIKNILQQYSDYNKIRAEIDKIQPYCDESDYSDSLCYPDFYDIYRNGNESICINKSEKNEIAYVRFDENDPELSIRELA